MMLQLEPFRKRHIPELFEWFSSERDVLIWGGAALSWPLQRRPFIDLIKRHRGTDPDREIWAVIRDGDMVGHFQIGFNRRLKTAALGRIALAPHARGQGLSARLLDLILETAFQRAWVHRVDLMVYAPNAPAISAYKRAGFVLEGTRRQTTPYCDEIWDTHIMSILRPEFDKRTERE
jgi:RimJ/RimL family protein N-acetyltransferase